MEESEPRFRPRVLDVVLTAGNGTDGEARSSLEAWSCEDSLLDSMGCLSGSALALAISLEGVRAGDEAPAFLCSVGSAVRRGIPTASRATVAGIAPLSNTYVESQIGGGFALRLVAIADAIVVRGQLPGRAGRVLIVSCDGSARIESYPELCELALPERCSCLREKHSGARGLCIGSAGDLGVSFASVATLEAPPSFTGRGGLGARLGAAGICALLIEGEDSPEPEGDSYLVESLAASPHLRARGAGGTFELAEAFAARGDLPVEFGARSAFGDRLAQRQSCPGCPTACRHVLSVGSKFIAGRFSGTFPLGRQLGLERGEDELELLSACNAVGVDATEMGATLVVLAQARRAGRASGAALHGDLEALRGEILEVSSGACAQGAEALAASVGLEHSVCTVRGSAARPVSDLAALLGQCVSARGSDPMRAFPFLSENGGDDARLARLLAPLALPAGSFESKDPAGKGRLVWWHENLANAVDASGFCSFSFAGLVGDGFADIDEMSRWLRLPGLKPGAEALLAAGASLALLQRELAERLGQQPDCDRPPWARGDLERPGMWDEYRLLRGLDPDGRVTPPARAKIGRLELAHHAQAQLPPVGDGPIRPAPPLVRETGRVALNARGILAQHLGQAATFEGDLPRTLGSLLRALAAGHPAADAWLWQRGDSAVSVYRSGERLTLHDLVANGDRLDLVVAISGG